MSAFLSDRTLSERLKTPKEGCSIEHFIAVLLIDAGKFDALLFF